MTTAALTNATQTAPTITDLIGHAVQIRGTNLFGLLAYVKGSWAGIEVAGEKGRVDEFQVERVIVDPT
jgi:hypothetical protein